MLTSLVFWAAQTQQQHQKTQVLQSQQTREQDPNMVASPPGYRLQCSAFLNEHWKDGLEAEAETVYTIYSKFVDLDSEMGSGLDKDTAMRLLEVFERNPKNKKRLKDSQYTKMFKEMVPEDGGKLTATAYLTYRFKKPVAETAGVQKPPSDKISTALANVNAALTDLLTTRKAIEKLVAEQGEEEEYALKPMNCPGHCLMFRQRVRSWRDLPIRYADFGVLHRNELSGALSGLTRVRRFQQDDAHIFCMNSQIKSEMADALKFMKDTYDIFGFNFKLKLSTRPEKYMGELVVWDQAEKQLSECLDEFTAKYQKDWVVDPGDGAFYGPKIDITVFDALQRAHQCATIQLDFQLPIRFDLQYSSADQTQRFQRPVMIHRAILGSAERMFAILTEHYAGKWPFWLSPRQIMIVPIDPKYYEYANEVRVTFHDKEYIVEVDDSKETVNKKIRNAQTSQWNYIFVVGEKEQVERSVNVRTRDNQIHGMKTMEEVLNHMAKLSREKLRMDPWDAASSQALLGDTQEAGKNL